MDDRRVEPDEDARSISAETTFDDDIRSHDALVPVLRHLSEKVAKRLKAKEVAGWTVVLKLKTGDFRQRTRNRRLEDPTQLADRIFRTGLSLLEKETGVDAFRLIGIGVTDLCEPRLADPPDLVDPQAGRRAKAEAAMDRLRDKFGGAAIETGYTFETRKPGPKTR
jgi:DNA polymerase-4